jgi:acyl carrier protein
VLQGARHLILVSRRDAASGKDKSAHPVALGLANLERLGAQIYCRTVDVADRDGLKAALDTSFRDGCPPLGGIFHLAGTLHDAAFTSLDRQAIAQVLHPKCGGILALHQLTEGQDLDLFVTFSSLAALVGSHGQSAYTAANAFLDAFSEYRRVQGLASITINWGPWSDQGMAASPEVAKQLAHTGIDWLDITTALAGLSAVLSQDVSPVVIAASDWQQLTTQLRGQPASPLLAKLVNNGTQAASDSSPLMLNDLVDHLLPLSPEAQQAWVEDQIIQMIAEIAELDSTQIQPDAEVTAIGLDSLMAMEMRSEMQSRYGINVPINKLLERRSIANLAVELLSSLLISLTAKQDIAEVVSVEENEVIEI